MHQCESVRFQNVEQNEMVVMMLPLFVAIGLRGVLKTMELSRALYLASQILLGVFLVICFILIFGFYFRSFLYTVVCDEAESRFPAGSLTFERFNKHKVRIYERVMVDEMLVLAAPGEVVDREYCSAKTYNLTARSAKTAHRLYYRQDGVTYCAVFHPDEEMQDILRSWIAARSAS